MYFCQKNGMGATLKIKHLYHFLKFSSGTESPFIGHRVTVHRAPSHRSSGTESPASGTESPASGTESPTPKLNLDIYSSYTPPQKLFKNSLKIFQNIQKFVASHA
jgi:hypothetical protein